MLLGSGLDTRSFRLTYRAMSSGPSLWRRARAVPGANRYFSGVHPRGLGGGAEAFLRDLDWITDYRDGADAAAGYGRALPDEHTVGYLTAVKLAAGTAPEPGRVTGRATPCA